MVSSPSRAEWEVHLSKHGGRGWKQRMLTSIHESVAFLFLLWTLSRRSGLAHWALTWKPETVTFWPNVDCYNLQSRKLFFFFYSFLVFAFHTQEMLYIRNAGLRDFLGLFCRLFAVHSGKVNVLHGRVLEKALHHVHTMCTIFFSTHRNIWNAFTVHSVHADMPRLLPHPLILRACVRRAEQQTKSRA